MIDEETEKELDKKFNEEPDDNEILLYSIKKKSSKLQPQNFINGGQGFGPGGQEGKGKPRILSNKEALSDLVHCTEEAFYGNPLKAVKHKKMKDQSS